MAFRIVSILAIANVFAAMILGMFNRLWSSTVPGGAYTYGIRSHGHVTYYTPAVGLYLDWFIVTQAVLVGIAIFVMYLHRDEMVLVASPSRYDGLSLAPTRVVVQRGLRPVVVFLVATIAAFAITRAPGEWQRPLLVATLAIAAVAMTLNALSMRRVVRAAAYDNPTTLEIALFHFVMFLAVAAVSAIAFLAIT